MKHSVFLLIIAWSVFAGCAFAAPEERVIVTGSKLLRPMETAYFPKLTAGMAIVQTFGLTDDDPIYLIRAGGVITLRSAPGPIPNTPLQPWDVIVIGDSLRKPQ